MCKQAKYLKNSKKYCFLLLLNILYNSVILSQVINKPLLNSKSVLYKEHVYVYGFKHDLNTTFTCFKYNQNLQLVDSLEYNLGKTKASEYLEIESDTLHNSLLFYFQLKNESKKVSVLRINSNLLVQSFSEDVNANHIKSVSLFGEEPYYVNDYLFSITQSKDTLSNQFYLTRYSLLSNTKQFEYQYNWQYAFERQYIQSIKIIYHDSSYLYLSALVNAGLKQGQWLLKVGIKKGELIKAIKLNAKGENLQYLITHCIKIPKESSLLLIGNVLTNKQIDFENNTINFGLAQKKSELCIINIDSTFEITKRWIQQIELPLSISKMALNHSVHLKSINVMQHKLNSITLTSDVFVLQNNAMSYVSSWIFEVSDLNTEIQFTPQAFYMLPNINEKSLELPNNIKSVSTANEFYNFITNSKKSPCLYHGLKNNIPTYYFLKRNVAKNTFVLQKFYLGTKAIDKKDVSEHQASEFPSVYVLKNALIFNRNNATNSFNLIITEN